VNDATAARCGELLRTDPFVHPAGNPTESRGDAPGIPRYQGRLAVGTSTWWTTSVVPFSSRTNRPSPGRLSRVRRCGARGEPPLPC